MSLLLLVLASGCPASAQPQWETASAMERRTMLRACAPQASSPGLAPEAAPAPAPAEAPAWSSAGRIALQAGVSVAAMAGSIALVGVVGASGPPENLAAVWFVGAGLSSLLVGAVVLGTGNAVGGRGSTAWTLLGALLGGVAGVGAAFGGLGIASAAFGPGFDSAIGGLIVGGFVGALLPTVGGILGYQLSHGDASPRVAFAPLPGGGVGVLSARF